MLTSRQVVGLLSRRQLWPACGSGVGWWRAFLFRLLALLPTIGMVSALAVIAYLGLVTLATRQELDARLSEIRESPFLALFASGKFYVGAVDEGCSTVEPEHLAYWPCLKIGAIENLAQAAPDLAGEAVINRAYPFNNIYLRIRNADGEHVRHAGLALAFRGPAADLRLLDQIRGRLRIPAKLDEGDLPVIVVTARELRRLGFASAREWPGQLLLSTPYQTQGVPFAVRVAEQLPYHRGFAISLESWDRLDGGYFHRKVDTFEIRGPIDDGIEDLEAHLQKVAAALGLESEPARPFSRGEWWVSMVDLSESLPRYEILARLPELPLGLGAFRDAPSSRRYGGAIFHLNPALLERTVAVDGSQQEEPVLRYLDEFFAEHSPPVQVRGELMEVLAESLADRHHFRRLQEAFYLGSLLMTVVVMVFFSIVLHSRLSTIGTLRAHGVRDSEILATTALEGLVLSLLGFAAAVCLLLQGRMPAGSELLWVLAWLFGAGQLGIMPPALLAMRRLEPAEMWTQ